MAVRANVLHVLSVTDCCHRVTIQLQVTNINNKRVGEKRLMYPSNYCFILNTFNKIKSSGRSLDDSCALLHHYASSGGNLLPTFRDNLFHLEGFSF